LVGVAELRTFTVPYRLTCCPARLYEAEVLAKDGVGVAAAVCPSLPPPPEAVQAQVYFLSWSQRCGTGTRYKIMYDFLHLTFFSFTIYNKFVEIFLKTFSL
jgi:hypothetical protein